MNRRSFLRSPAGLLCVPALRAQPAPQYETHWPIYKQAGLLINRPNETTTIRRTSGQLIALSTPREGHTPVAIEVRDYHSGQMIARHPWSGMFATFAEDPNTGVIHAWGASAGAGTGNMLIHSTLGNDYSPSPPDVVKRFPRIDRVWNTSVCRDPFGNGWIMALETLYPETLPTDHGFHIIFWRAQDLSGPWHPAGHCFNYSTTPPYRRLFDAFCPLIKPGPDGKVYLFYMTIEGAPKHFNTYVARSATLQPGSWEMGPLVMTGDGPGLSEINNASDLDFDESDGLCWGTYIAGNQEDWVPVKRWMFPGTKDTFLRSLYPD